MRMNKISRLLALMLIAGATLLPLTAYAAGGEDTTPPKLTALLDGDTLNITSSDEDSGIETVFVDETRINSLTDGVATVALKDYAGNQKQVSVYVQDYAGNHSETVTFDNPYYEEPTETPPATSGQSQDSAVSQPVQTQATSGSSSNRGTASSTASTTEGSASSGNAASESTGGETSGEDASDSVEETASSVPEGAFTPEGTGTVLDTVTGEDGDKQFYTVTTEEDLMALAEKNEGSMICLLGLIPIQAFALSPGQKASSWLGDRYMGSDGQHYYAPAPYTYLVYYSDGTMDVRTSSGPSGIRNQ